MNFIVSKEACEIRASPANRQEKKYEKLKTQYLDINSSFLSEKDMLGKFYGLYKNFVKKRNNIYKFLILSTMFFSGVFFNVIIADAQAQIIFEDDFSNDVGWVASNSQSSSVESATANGCYGNLGCVAPPSKWNAYNVGASTQSLKIVANTGKGGNKPALQLNWGMGTAQRQAISLRKHLTGDRNSGYDELYIRYEVKFDNGWSAGNGTNIGYWKWFRLWQYRPPYGIANYGENQAPYDTRYAIAQLSNTPPSWGIVLNANYDGLSVSGPSWNQNYVTSSNPCPTCGFFESIKNWDFNNLTGQFLNDPQDWHTVEWHIKLNTGTGNCDGTENGEYDVWLDGVKQDTAKQYIKPVYGAPTGCTKLPLKKYKSGFNYLVLFDNFDDWASTWTTDKYLYLDNVVVSTNPIGKDYVPGGATLLPSSDITSPSAPVNLTATAISTSQINLSWTASTDNIGVAGYKIYRNGALITTQNNQSTTYSDTGLAASIAYAYKVSAIDAAGNESAQSTQTSATTQAAPALGSWQETLERNFDIVDTFDELQDWKGVAWKTQGEQITVQGSPNDFPKKSDGSPSIWNAYTKSSSGDLPGNWIQNHGAGNYWSGSKSMRMSIVENEPGYGPSRFITYFGNGQRTSGYDDMYAFFMVKINPAQWPTAIDNITKVGTYNSNNPYADFYWKFGGVAHGFIEPGKHADYAQGTRWLYGWHQLHFNTRRLSIDSYKTTLRFEGWYENTLAGGDIDAGVADNIGQTGTVAMPLDEWYGLELHWKLGTPGTNTGTYEMWMYDSSGNKTTVFSRNDLYLQHSKLAGDKFNKFWIGGNTSNSYSYGTALVPQYYIDDVIIDNQPIGQKYFSLLNGAPQPLTYNLSDFTGLMADWLKTQANLVSDFNHDGVVNARDLGIMMSNWK